MDYVGHGWGMGFGMWFTVLFFVLLVIYLLKENTKGKGHHTSAQDILDRRYANGEIDTKSMKRGPIRLKKNDSKI